MRVHEGTVTPQLSKAVLSRSPFVQQDPDIQMGEKHASCEDLALSW
jgi:hypothetical protein